jgi:hypothetical protein
MHCAPSSLTDTGGAETGKFKKLFLEVSLFKIKKLIIY